MEATTNPSQIDSLWHRVLEDPRFQDLPYKVETNQQGQLILSPHKPRHGVIQYRIARLLEEHLGGRGHLAVEFTVKTPQGMKVPDVIWMSDERYQQLPADAEASPLMPELLVEVISTGNTAEELAEKRRLYLAGGAEEAWMATLEGEITFYDGNGQIPSSKIAPSFPARIDS